MFDFILNFGSDFGYFGESKWVPKWSLNSFHFFLERSKIRPGRPRAAQRCPRAARRPPRSHLGAIPLKNRRKNAAKTQQQVGANVFHMFLAKSVKVGKSQAATAGSCFLGCRQGVKKHQKRSNRLVQRFFNACSSNLSSQNSDY